VTSIWSDLRRVIRRSTLVQQRVHRLIVEVDKIGDRLVDHDRRLTHIETLIAVARRKRPPA
jgi:hypothetical protein